MADHDSGVSWRAPLHLGVALLLCVVAGVLRYGPLGPSSLWLDDAWVALVSKTSGVADTFMVGLTGPGFAFLLKGWLAVVGFSETAAQLPAFVFGVVAPGLLYLVAVARGLSFAGAFVAGALLVASPVHIVYSTRVKHYTLDVVLAIVLIALAWRLIESPASRRLWAWLVVVACAAVAVSGGVAPMAVAALGVGLLASLFRGRAELAVALGAWGAWAVFALGWYVLVLRPAITPAIRGYWAEQYVGSVADLLTGLGGVVDGLSALPVAVVGLAVVTGVAVLVVARPLVALLLVAPVVGLAVLAAFGLAPLGGGRTDAFLYPALALLVGALVHRVAQWRVVLGAAAAALLTVAVVATADFAPPYPQEDVRSLVAQVDQQRRPGERLLVYPSTIWAYALYSDLPVDLVRSDNPWGFRPHLNDTDVTLLEANRDAPERYAPQVASAVEGTGQVWLLSSHRRDDLEFIASSLRSHGFVPRRRLDRAGAALVSWHRR